MRFYSLKRGSTVFSAVILSLHPGKDFFLFPFSRLGGSSPPLSSPLRVVIKRFCSSDRATPMTAPPFSLWEFASLSPYVSDVLFCPRAQTVFRPDTRNFSPFSYFSVTSAACWAHPPSSTQAPVSRRQRKRMVSLQGVLFSPYVCSHQGVEGVLPPGEGPGKLYSILFNKDLSTLFS